MRRLIAISLFAVLAAACGSSTDSASPANSDADVSSAPGSEASSALDFVATDLSGTEVDAATLGGGPLVIWFWAPW